MTAKKSDLELYKAKVARVAASVLKTYGAGYNNVIDQVFTDLQMDTLPREREFIFEVDVLIPEERITAQYRASAYTEDDARAVVAQYIDGDRRAKRIYSGHTRGRKNEVTVGDEVRLVTT